MKDFISMLFTANLVIAGPTFFDYGFRSQAQMDLFNKQAKHVIHMAQSCYSHAQLNNVDRYFMENLYYSFRFRDSRYIRESFDVVKEVIGDVRGQINNRYVQVQMLNTLNTQLCQKSLLTQPVHLQ